jgi:aminoglycoside phosphotransferase (APT) family kinase protein
LGTVVVSLIYRSLPWTNAQTTDPDLVISSLARALNTHRAELSLVREPVSSLRSTLYFAGELGDSNPRWVVKQTHPATAVDAVPTLPVAAELRSLALLESWLDGDAPVARPVGLLPEIDALALEFVPGRALRAIFTDDLRRPAAEAVSALRATGDYLRRVHIAGNAGEDEVDLAEVAERVLSRSAEALAAAGLSLPEPAAAALRAVRSQRVRTRRTLLYGDFVPANLIVTSSGHIVGIDPVLQEAGLPEDDAARFLAVVMSDTKFVPGLVLPSVRRTGRELQEAFLEGWSGQPVPSILLGIRLMQALSLRWLRRRELTRLREAPARARRLLIDQFMTHVIQQAAEQLAQTSGGY